MPAEPDLADAYEAAWDEWDANGEADPWDELVADGLDRPDVPEPS